MTFFQISIYPTGALKLSAAGLKMPGLRRPFGLGNVILVSRNCTHESGTRVSRNRQPVNPQPIGHLPRRMYALALQPECDPLLGILVTVESRLGGTVAFKKLWNPAIPSCAIDYRYFPIFTGLQFCSENFCLDRVIGIVGTESGGFVVFYFVRVNILDIPER